MPWAGRQHADGPPSVRMHRLPTGAAHPRCGPPLGPLWAEWPRTGPSGPRIRPPPRRGADFAPGKFAAPAVSLVSARPWAASRRHAPFLPKRLPLRQHRRLRVAQSRWLLDPEESWRRSGGARLQRRCLYRSEGRCFLRGRLKDTVLLRLPPPRVLRFPTRIGGPTPIHILRRRRTKEKARPDSKKSRFFFPPARASLIFWFPARHFFLFFCFVSNFCINVKKRNYKMNWLTRRSCSGFRGNRVADEGLSNALGIAMNGRSQVGPEYSRRPA